MTREEQIEQLMKIIIERPVDIGRSFGYDKLHPIDENGYSLHNEWLKMMLFSTEEELLQAHRESYKTTCVIVAIAISMLIFNKMNIAFIRKTDDDIKEVIKGVKKCLLTETAIGIAYLLYGTELSLLKDSSSEITTNIYVDVRGTEQLTGRGVGSSLTGKHYDKIFTDDICNPKDRTSRAEREATKAAYGELGNVLNDRIESNPYVGVVFNSGTPWHRNDVYTLMPKPHVYPYQVTGILSDEKIERQRNKLTTSLFTANYELKHVSDEKCPFKEASFSYEEQMFSYGMTAHVDCAFGGDNYTAFTAMVKHNGIIYAYGKVWDRHVRECYSEIKALCKQFKVDIIYLEDNADKGYVGEEMDKIGLWTKVYHENQNKHVKVMTWLYTAWADIRWHKDTDPNYLSQIIDYTEDAEPDDAPDSCSSLLREAMQQQEAFAI